jgi:hypothetical protein
VSYVGLSGRACDRVLSADGLAIAVTPRTPLPPGSTFAVLVEAPFHDGRDIWEGVRDLAMNPLAARSYTRFTTGP